MFLKYALSLVFVAFINSFLNAQSNEPKVDINSTRAVSLDKGFFMNVPGFNRPGYTTNCEQINCPSIIYALSFWFGGLNQNNDLKLSASSFGINNFSPGPYSSSNSYDTPQYTNAYNPSIWIVTRDEIIYHIDNINQPQYQIPPSILKWPAHGEASLGTANNLAPFVDVDGNGIYNPDNGDYPCIKGDMASYIIINDHKPVSNPSGESMGLEIHAMTYQFVGENYIDSTTFMELRVINRGGQTYNEFKSAMFVYFALGGPEDDYMSVFPQKNTFFVMNGDNYDESLGSFVGLFENPPAAGIKALNTNLIHGARFPKAGTFPSPFVSIPQSDVQFWSYLNGTWIDGAPFVQGSGYPLNTDSTYIQTNFAINNNAYFTEGANFFPYFSNSNMGFVGFESQALLPAQELKFDFAFFMNRQGDFVENMHGLYNYADLIEDFYYENIVALNCQQQGTGIPDNFSPPFDWSPWMVEVKRLDGLGNMGFSIDLTNQTFGEALWNNTAEIPTYKASKSPIYVKIENPGTHALGRFELLFRDYGATIQAIDTASWTIYRYDINTNELLDFIDSETTIEIGDLQYIPQWGISVQIKQKPYFVPTGMLPIAQNLSTMPIEVTSHFDTETTGWLAGVQNNSSTNLENWIRSGFDYFFDDNDLEACFSVSPKDYVGNWSNLLNGTIGHFALLRHCDSLAPAGTNSNLNIELAQARAVIAQTPSVDLVFTHEKDKWTRSVVVEMCDDSSISQGNAQKMKPRNRPSVDKNGYSAGHPEYNAAEGDLISPVGMGWFPGFAIDVETGRRLNVVFGENSFLGGQNGSDMLWNPTSQMYDQVGNPRFGGQHVVFVIGENINNSGMPIYDSCATFFQNINSMNNTLNRDAWQSATWTMYPMLREGYELLEKPVLIRMRVNKRYENHTITGINDGKPAFEWNISSLLPADLSTENHIMPDALIYPNPTQSHFFIQFQNMQPDVVRVYSTTGVLVHEQTVSGGENVVRVDTENLARGLYVVQVGEVIRRVVVE